MATLQYGWELSKINLHPYTGKADVEYKNLNTGKIEKGVIYIVPPGIGDFSSEDQKHHKENEEKNMWDS